jgi:MFS family permease
VTRGIGFPLVAFAFVVNMLGTTLPTPLYPLYAQTYGFSPLSITVIFATYAFGVVAGLLLLGHLSDEIGRKPVLIAGLLLSLASALAFLFAHDPLAIYLGRVCSGLSAGAFTGTCTAMLIDLSDVKRRMFATTVAVAVNIGGLGCGTLLAGVLAQYAPGPERTAFAIDVALIVVALVAIALAPETVARRADARIFKIQPLRVPLEIRTTFTNAAIAGSCGFAAAGIFSSVAPSFLAHTLHLPNHVLAGLLVTVMMFSSAAGQLAVRALAARALNYGTAGVLVGVALLACALIWLSPLLLFVSAALSGFGQGLAIGAGLARINERIAERRGEVSSAYFVILYAALAIPVIGIGLLATRFGIASAGLVFCTIASVALLGVLVSENVWKLRANPS